MPASTLRNIRRVKYLARLLCCPEPTNTTARAGTTDLAAFQASRVKVDGALTQQAADRSAQPCWPAAATEHVSCTAARGLVHGSRLRTWATTMDPDVDEPPRTFNIVLCATLEATYTLSRAHLCFTATGRCVLTPFTVVSIQPAERAPTRADQRARTGHAALC